MTDPIQTANPQQQGSQQGKTDDVLGGEEIFAKIPDANPVEDNISYDDIVENKYQFEPIPEIEEPAPIQVPKVQPVQGNQQAVQQVQRPQQATPVQQVRASIQQSTQPVQQIQRPQIQNPVPQVPIQQNRPSVAPQVQIPRPAPVQATPISPVEEIIEEELPEEEIIADEIADQELAREEVIEQEEIDDNEDEVSREPEEIEEATDSKFQTDVQKKFGELVLTTKKIYELKNSLGSEEETFDILGANNDKIYISYRFLLDESTEPILFITKIEQDKETEEETVNELKFTFNEENESLEVMINETLLFDEVNDFSEDQKKKMQVIDKLNKFIFLSSEELRKMEKEIKEREENERERKKLQEIFRNF